MELTAEKRLRWHDAIKTDPDLMKELKFHTNLVKIAAEQVYAMYSIQAEVLEQIANDKGTYEERLKLLNKADVRRKILRGLPRFATEDVKAMARVLSHAQLLKKPKS